MKKIILLFLLFIHISKAMHTLSTRTQLFHYGPIYNKIVRNEKLDKINSMCQDAIARHPELYPVHSTDLLPPHQLGSPYYNSRDINTNRILFIYKELNRHTPQATWDKNGRTFFSNEYLLRTIINDEFVLHIKETEQINSLYNRRTMLDEVLISLKKQLNDRIICPGGDSKINFARTLIANGAKWNDYDSVENLLITSQTHPLATLCKQYPHMKNINKYQRELEVLCYEIRRIKN